METDSHLYHGRSVNLSTITMERFWCSFQSNCSGFKHCKKGHSPSGCSASSTTWLWPSQPALHAAAKIDRISPYTICAFGPGWPWTTRWTECSNITTPQISNMDSTCPHEDKAFDWTWPWRPMWFTRFTMPCMEKQCSHRGAFHHTFGNCRWWLHQTICGWSWRTWHLLVWPWSAIQWRCRRRSDHRWRRWCFSLSEGHATTRASLLQNPAGLWASHMSDCTWSCHCWTPAWSTRTRCTSRTETNSTDSGLPSRWFSTFGNLVWSRFSHWVQWWRCNRLHWHMVHPPPTSKHLSRITTFSTWRWSH